MNSHATALYCSSTCTRFIQLAQSFSNPNKLDPVVDPVVRGALPLLLLRVPVAVCSCVPRGKGGCSGPFVRLLLLVCRLPLPLLLLLLTLSMDV